RNDRKKADIGFPSEADDSIDSLAKRSNFPLSHLQMMAWKACQGCVVSMLSLNISGAFPSVSHERLLWVLCMKGFPPWVLWYIEASTNLADQGCHRPRPVAKSR